MSRSRYLGRRILRDFVRVGEILAGNVGKDRARKVALYDVFRGAS